MVKKWLLHWLVFSVRPAAACDEETESFMHTEQHKNKISRGGVLWLLGALLAVLFLVSFCLGRYGVPVGQIMRILMGQIFPIPHQWTDTMETLVLNVRMPRILMACLIGCCLAAAGAAYQGVFQNPMASPDLLGASDGAAFGAALSILLGASTRQITLWAFLISLLTVALVFLIARCAPGNRVVNLILAGIMVSSLFKAGTSYIKLVADPNNQLPAITYWLMGSLSGIKWSQVTLAVPPMLLGLVPLFCIRWRINLLTLGDMEARTLGVHTDRLRLVVIFCATLLTAASISAAGMIGWVGLVIPHLARKLVGSDYKYLLPASMLLGASFLLAVDNISRNLLAVEIPIGILTAFVGAPFFVYLLLRREKTL